MNFVKLIVIFSESVPNISHIDPIPNLCLLLLIVVGIVILVLVKSVLKIVDVDVDAVVVDFVDVLGLIAL